MIPDCAALHPGYLLIPYAPPGAFGIPQRGLAGNPCDVAAHDYPFH